MTDLFLGQRQTSEEIQQVYDQAYANGILEEPLIYDPDDGVIAAWIDKGALHETIRGHHLHDDLRERVT